jgi:hypothetical protein
MVLAASEAGSYVMSFALFVQESDFEKVMHRVRVGSEISLPLNAFGSNWG